MYLVEEFKEVLVKVYGNDDLKNQLKRYSQLFDLFINKYNNKEVYIFSSPGRVELSGNHTDHNLGKVLAASVNIDSIAVASKNDKNYIRVYSLNYGKDYKIKLNDLDKRKDEEGTTEAIIKGILKRFIELGYSIGGFVAIIQSDVLSGSGISSSASIELLLGKILSTLFNEGNISNETLARIGQWSENNYFGKPCGLMDQLACAIGGIISIDFENSNNPKIKKVNYDFRREGYKLLLVDSGINHEDLTNEYASIPIEMKQIASHFNKKYLVEVDEEKFFSNIHILRTKFGDRAVLRAIHFFEENKRVDLQISALQNNDMNEFLKLINNSGNSSNKYLQNIYSTKNTKEQGLNLALAVSERFINKNSIGACRVHGGGFAGTILVILKNEYVDEYKQLMKNIFGSDAIMEMSIRQSGVTCLNEF